MGFVAMTTYTYSDVCNVIALYTANAYSAEHKMSASGCTRSMAGLDLVKLLQESIEILYCF